MLMGKSSIVLSAAFLPGSLELLLNPNIEFFSKHNEIALIYNGVVNTRFPRDGADLKVDSDFNNYTNKLHQVRGQWSHISTRTNFIEYFRHCMHCSMTLNKENE